MLVFAKLALATLTVCLSWDSNIRNFLDNFVSGCRSRFFPSTVPQKLTNLLPSPHNKKTSEIIYFKTILTAWLWRHQSTNPTPAKPSFFALPFDRSSSSHTPPNVTPTLFAEKPTPPNRSKHPGALRHRPTTGVTFVPRQEEPSEGGGGVRNEPHPHPGVLEVTGRLELLTFHGGSPQFFHRHVGQLYVRGDSIVFVTLDVTWSSANGCMSRDFPRLVGFRRRSGIAWREIANAKEFESACAVQTKRQRRPRIRSRLRQDSVFFSEPRSKICEKPGPRVTFHFGQ